MIICRNERCAFNREGDILRNHCEHDDTNKRFVSFICQCVVVVVTWVGDAGEFQRAASKWATLERNFWIEVVTTYFTE